VLTFRRAILVALASARPIRRASKEFRSFSQLLQNLRVYVSTASFIVDASLRLETATPSQKETMKSIPAILAVLAFSAVAYADDKPATTAPATATPTAATPAAGEKKHKSPEEVFKKLDTDGDGFISLEEFKASPQAQKDPAKAEERFKKMDTNGDGKVSLEEFKAAREAHAKKPAN
jgi:hypothetical protein